MTEVTEKMVEAARHAFITGGNMRAAIEAALSAREPSQLSEEISAKDAEISRLREALRTVGQPEYE